MDVCCLNRPFDNQSQVRVHLESEAILQIIEFSKNGKLNWFNSDVIEFEIDNIENEDKKEKVLTLLELSTSKIELNDSIINKSTLGIDIDNPLNWIKNII